MVLYGHRTNNNWDVIGICNQQYGILGSSMFRQTVCLWSLETVSTLRSSGNQTQPWEIPKLNGSFNGKIICTWWMFHCNVWLPEGNPSPPLTQVIGCIQSVGLLGYPTSEPYPSISKYVKKSDTKPTGCIKLFTWLFWLSKLSIL